MSISDLSIAEQVAGSFNLSGRLIGCNKYGNGHINDTFLLEYADTEQKITRYILQAINTNVFKDIAAVMDNIRMVTEHLKRKTENSSEVMNIVKTRDGEFYHIDSDGTFWRVYEFVENSVCLQVPESLSDFFQCAVAFGRFQKYLTDFPVEKLNETIPDFHNTPKRYENFLRAVEQDAFGRVKNVQPEIDFLNERSSFYSVLTDNQKCGKLPIRVSHNDTKCNNVLLNKETHEALCVIDLDTIMPGFSVTDFGDAIRFGASTADEDEIDLTKVHFDIEKFRVYTEGFLYGNGGLMTDSEIMLLPEGAKMMTIECGMRFLTDYLSGDTYFKTSRPNHNLDRCRVQLKLVSEIEEQWDMMKACVKTYIK